MILFDPFHSILDTIEHDDDDGHSHDSHHKHDAKITVDLHNIMDLIDQKFQALEERLVAAIQHQNETKPAAVLKSYRTYQR